MWRKEEGRPQGSPEISTGTVNPTMGMSGGKTAPAPVIVSPKAAACVSQGIRIKGDIIGSEELFIDGQIEGTIICGGATVTLGPNSTVKADVTARELIVRGRVEGKLTGTERIEVWRSARVQGDQKTGRVSIEEGAELHGMLEAGRPPLSSSERASREQSKKTEAIMPKDPSKADDQPNSGMAVAGAD